MNKGSPMMMYRRITIGAAISMLLIGCSSEPTKPAPITSINNSSGTYSTASTSTPAKTSGSATTMAMDTSRPNIVYTEGQELAPATSTANTSAQGSGNPFNQNKAASNQVATSGDRIVYNRSYSDIPKGSYNGGPTYTVSRGDTLFYIAWITGNDYRELAQKNNISEPYALSAGQTLNVGGGINTGGTLAGTSNNGASVSSVTSNQNPTTSVDSTNSGAYTASSSKQNVDKTLPTATTAGTTTAATSTATTPATASSSSTSNVRWRWPTEGKVIENFSTSEGGNKGIDIAGSRGQSVLAAADGRVVYAGNALRGYGNLIIIKHNDDYLSAYAHNDSMLVAEQQEVKAGQKIATMGSTGTSSVRLHFEIRYKGKSVNPLQHLPQR
ncbi:murein hydrolase activator NlpD [Budviciaceae bacterium BWR-B9]|uniref:Murein hydrolase activator NlpD n=1 Tax=Limnobaculum allomyrinae TaxID=2791986 RepID=A0ABS1IP09_9GAMM|nr:MULTISPECIES: murein hydrolase activator NlpD [Limnobaculum]MBK5143495.1 murein hydrolase activator NlpD [Limnobaculum allomyrinae]MBV7691383.1 murein hydrolase activator NlpD [Limnobaculum sp. M2-1]